MQRGEEEIVELVNAVIDGEATPEEKKELQLLLLSSVETRELYEATKRIAQRLEGMPGLEPPRELRESVLGVVLASREPSRPAGGRHHTALKYVWAAAAALVLGFLILGRRPMTDTDATMAPAWPVVQRIKTERATLIVRHHGDLYELEAVAAGSPVSIHWDTTKLIGVSEKKDASFGKASTVIVRSRDGASAVQVWVSAGNEEVLRAVVPLR